jgi:hypothetical protein
MRYQSAVCSGLEKYGVNMRINLRYINPFAYIYSSRLAAGILYYELQMITHPQFSILWNKRITLESYYK